MSGARVTKVGAYYNGTPKKIVGNQLEHDNFPGWRFHLDLGLEDARLLGLTIEAIDQDNPPNPGIQKTTMLAKLPIEELATAARRAYSESDMRQRATGSRVAVIRVRDSGEFGPLELIASDEVRQELDDARRLIPDPAVTTRGTKQRLTDEEIAKDLKGYYDECVVGGRKVQEFLANSYLNDDTLYTRQKKGKTRGIWEPPGKQGQTAGRFTKYGSELLERIEKDQ